MASIILRHKSPSLTLNPQKTLIYSRFYCNSSSNNNNNNDDNNNGGNPKNFSSFFSNMKPNSSPQSPPSSGGLSFGEIRKNLSSFRSRSTDSPPPLTQNKSGLNSRITGSFRNLNNRNAGNSNPGLLKGGEMSLDKIKESLQKMRVTNPNPPTTSTTRGNGQFSLSNFKDSFRMGPTSERIGEGKVNVIGGGGIADLPMASFGKEIRGDDDNESKYRLVRWYTHAELGAKLKELRPSDKKNKEGGFSLSELRGRLGKLRELEEENMAENKGRVKFAELGSALSDIQKDKRMQKVPKLDLFIQKSYPPKEHLIEKYFHPDNMSAAEKMKIELKKVRDEFKISESDCGSTRVQIAQLTTEILHLSSVLHKKDKHSRRGLHAKVQQRKKLLKYLRRTDWESYCFVLSKLGLRDNPDYKN